MEVFTSNITGKDRANDLISALIDRLVGRSHEEMIDTTGRDKRSATKPLAGALA